MEQQEDFDLLGYVYALWRRKWIFILVGLVTISLALYVISILPIVYRSTGTVLVERQEIPEEWVNSTVTSFADERIQAIGQRVLTTENLLRIIDKYDLFSELRDQLTLNEKASMARNNFSIENVKKSGPRRRDAATAAFLVSYDDASAEKAYNVASELVTLYLNENKNTRTQAAIDTRLFLEAEADRIERQLTDIEEKISKFKENNIGVLPEQQNLNIGAYERVEQNIQNINSTLGALEERKIVLESSIGSARRILNASRATAVVGGVVIDPARQRLDELRSEYISLQTRYSESHPDLKRLLREIGILESELGSSQSGEQTSGGSNAISLQDDAAIIQLSADLKSANNEQRSLRARKKELLSKLDDLEVRINKTPAVELEYRSLIRDHENIQTKYNDIRDKQNSARVSQSLEEEEKGERFTLIEPPRLATRPFSPNYPKMYVMALGLAFLSGLGAVFGLEFLDGTIRNVRSVEKLTGAPVLATVGYLENPRERKRKSFKNYVIVAILVLVALGILYLVKTYQMRTEEQQATIKETIKSWVSD